MSVEANVSSGMSRMSAANAWVAASRSEVQSSVSGTSSSPTVITTSAPPTKSDGKLPKSTGSKYPCVVVNNTNGNSPLRTVASITP